MYGDEFDYYHYPLDGTGGLLFGLAVTLPMLGAFLFGGGTGTAHAYTDSEQNYLFQLGPEMLNLPGPNDIKLKAGYAVCDYLRGGGQPMGAVNLLKPSVGQYFALNLEMEATAWLCPDQNSKTDQTFGIGSPPGPNGGIVPEPPAPGPWTPSFPANPFPTR